MIASRQHICLGTFFIEKHADLLFHILNVQLFSDQILNILSLFLFEVFPIFSLHSPRPEYFLSLEFLFFFISFTIVL